MSKTTVENEKPDGVDKVSFYLLPAELLTCQFLTPFG